MRIDATGNLLLDTRQVPSPNFDERPDENDISLIVIHGISLPPGVPQEARQASQIRRRGDR